MAVSEIKGILEPWYFSLENPEEYQFSLLEKLLKVYSKTEYGELHKAEDISDIDEFRKRFPVVTYQDLRPWLDQVYRGNYRALFAEKPVAFMMTRGTTGKPKIIPITPSEFENKMQISSRALLNYVYRRNRYEILEGYDLNLNFPSKVGKLKMGDEEYYYGYSSGIYAHHSARKRRLRLVPEQQEIDELGADVSKEGWKKRFELVYQRARDKEVTMLIGVVQVMIEFAKYLKKEHKAYPRDLWDMQLIVATSAPKIQTVYKPRLEALYGDVSVVELYGATEGIFAQQLDEKPFISPNYDSYFLEVKVGKGFKMLHEMRPGERGRIIISSYLFPRYDIGDLIVCYGKNYFRVIGRTRLMTILDYWISKVL